MADNEYHTDKLQIYEQQQIIASEALEEIEKRSEGTPVAFLKNNYDNKKLRDRSREPVFKMMLALALTKICGFSGINREITDFDAQDIPRMILSTYKDLTLEEIYKAFELERYGVYEDKTEHFQLFNAEYVAAVLKKYKNWKQNTKIQHNISPPSKLPEITESQKEEITTKAVIRVFDEFKETQVMPEPNAYIFDILYERNIIKPGDTPEIQSYYQRKYSQAAAEIEREVKSSEITSHIENRAMREELQKIIDGNSDKVVVRSKKIILTEYFSKLIKNNQHIADLLQK